MLCFLPPIPGAPQPKEPPPRRTVLGITVALILVAAGMMLPYLRPVAHHADRPRSSSGTPSQ